MDSVTVADFERIVQIGGELNFPTFDRWIGRLEATTGRAMATAEARSAQTRNAVQRLQALGTPAPTSPSPSA